MSPTDVPPAPTPHSSEIIGSNWPSTSETGTVSSVISLFQQAAESVGTGNTAEVMHALIEANATGETPTQLVSDFTADERAAFDRALRQLNMGQGASVMAQDILNSKVQLNGTVASFETAVEQLIASYAGSGGPGAPQNQAEFQQKYNELLQQAKEQADSIGQNHKNTQEQLVAGVQKGATPEVPSTMAPTSSSNPTVPGMPDGALGSMLQQVGGLMSKPPNLPMPNLGQMAQPVAQSAQQAIQELMKKAGGSGVPISDDALKKLTTSAGLNSQGTSLSSARDSSPQSSSERSAEPRAGELSSSDSSGEANARHSTGSSQPGADAEADAESSGETVTAASEIPTVAPSTPAPESAAPSTVLSSGDAAAGGPDPLTAPRTHVSSGDAATPGSTLGPSAAATPTAAGAGQAGGAAPMGAPMAPMMAPMMGGAAAGGNATGAGAGSGSAGGSGGDAKRAAFRPEMDSARSELADYGSDFKGLDHATDMQHVAASIAAGLVRAHHRVGASMKVAVGIADNQTVFATSDGLSYLAPGVRAPAGLVPLNTMVPDAFVARWIGCDQPWRPLLEAAEIGLIPQLDSIVTTDESAGQLGVMVLGESDIASVNITAGAQPRSDLDAIDVGDIDSVVRYLTSTWGRPMSTALDLERRAMSKRWLGEQASAEYAPAWVQYLLAAALADLRSGDVDDARYALRNALRVPVNAQVRA